MSQKKYTTLRQWLATHDKELYETIKDAYAISMLNAQKGNGITFLYPANDNFRAKLIQNIQDCDFNNGVRQLQALLLNDCLQDLDEWHEKKDDIPNKLGNKIEITSVDKNKVKLTNGALIKKLNESDIPEDSNFAVWKYVGEVNMPVKGIKAEYKYCGPNKKKIIKNKSRFSNLKIKTTPKMLAQACEKKTIQSLRNGTYFEKNVFMDMVLSYLEYIYKKNKDLYKNIVKEISYSPEASFYCVFEPYTKESPKLFSEWLNSTRGTHLFSNPAERYIKHLENAIKLSEADRKKSRNLRNDVEPFIHPDILREELWNIYDGNTKKIVHDEIRKLLHDELLMKISLNDIGAVNDLFFDVAVLQYDNKGNIMTSDYKLYNDRQDPVGWCSTVVSFAKSDCFMYTPYKVGDDESALTTLRQLSDKQIGSQRNIVHLKDISMDDYEDEDTFIVTQTLCCTYIQMLAENNDKGKNIQNTIADALLAAKDDIKQNSRLMEVMKNLISVDDHEKLKNEKNDV